MLHLVARTVGGELLFRDWREAGVAWRAVLRACPGLTALVLMPNHLHLLHDSDVRLRLAAALSGYTRWRDHHRGRPGPRMAPLPPAEPLDSRQKVQRNVRYTHLNPCRAGLCRDPLAWPFSTHRDAPGLAARPVVDAHRDPAWLHEYVSSDPTVHVQGTPLPVEHVQVADPVQVLHAVSAACRTPLSELRRQGPARRLYLRAARTLTPASLRDLARVVGAGHQSALRAGVGLDRDVRLVSRLLDDPRFGPLGDEPEPWRSLRPR